MTTYSDIVEADDGYDRGTLIPLARRRSIMKDGPKWKLAAPQVLLDLAKAIAGPGDALRGKLDPNSPDAMERALNIPIAQGAAGSVMTAVRGAPAKGQLNTFMVPKELLDRATPTMKLPGVGEIGYLGGAEKVNETLFKSLPLNKVRKILLSEIYDAPKVYDRFPEFRDTELWVQRKNPSLPASSSKSGGFHPSTGVIQADSAFIDGPFGLKGVIGHELTHAAQKRMQLQHGTNQKVEKDRRTALQTAANPDTEEGARLLRKIQDTKDVEQAVYGSSTADAFLPYLSNVSERMAREGQFRRLPGSTATLLRSLDDKLPDSLLHMGRPAEMEAWYLGLPEKDKLQQILS